MHKFVFATIASTATLLVSVSAYANDTTGKTKVASASSFVALDRNGDHRISRSEAGFDRIMSQTFAEIDTDGDGFVSPAEFEAAEKPRATVTNLDR